MSINKRYYWMKLFHTFFQDPKIKKLKKLPGGDTYVIIVLKIMLQTIKTEGIYTYEGLEPSLAEELELKIDEESKSIQIVLDYLYNVNSIQQISEKEYFLPQVKDCVGSETASTQRSRKSRAQHLLNTQMLQSNKFSTKCNTEKEIDLKKKLKDITILKQLENLSSQQISEINIQSLKLSKETTKYIKLSNLQNVINLAIYNSEYLLEQIKGV